MPTTWRPPPSVRPIAIGIVRRGNELLLMSVCDDDGNIKGWRPLGGSIEFGERAADALKREFVEELGLAIKEPRLLTVMENLFHHHGTQGHEIVFVFEAAFADARAYEQEQFTFADGGVHNGAQWVDLARFRDGREPLFPDGLIEALS
jgi:ADP-ribose pyrophosphatase YjhB (NUDIX family)